MAEAVKVFNFPKEAPPRQVLKLGASGTPVAELQKALRLWGFEPGPVKAGEYDQLTVDAVRALQRKLGVNPTGEIDQATKSVIKGDLASDNSVLKEAARASSFPALAVAPAPTTALAAPTPQPAPAAAPFYLQPPFLLAAGGAAAFLWDRVFNTPAADALLPKLGEPGVELMEGLEEPAPKKPRKKRKPRAKAKAEPAPVVVKPSKPPKSAKPRKPRAKKPKKEKLAEPVEAAPAPEVPPAAVQPPPRKPRKPRAKKVEAAPPAAPEEVE